MIRITDNEFDKLASYIQANYGIFLKKEKQALVTGRLQAELVQNGFKNFSEYFEYILADTSGSAVTAMINKITTNHTFFMRESEHFDFFQSEVLPFLHSTVRNNDLRIWSAGCSSGEEPYTLAMILDEYFGNEKGTWDTKVLATDISTKVLDTAKSGIYSNDKVGTMPTHFRAKYFRRMDEKSSVIHDKIRNEVIFGKFNLMEERFPFKKKFHVIFCRNVMIYFDEKTKTELVNKFYDFLEPGGYLFIGHSESLNRETTRFSYVKPALYRKK
ncbi:CheR family methyltransferase [Parasporobacterium paucivorans]|uniref:protein-glutamate O-methyltransferase n=1 Tax=Parasporobacterium paucivorans DSM 15970 TaxID=1122934 RepID=A0A1M6IAI1_9FIRM|nr:protein-glutamate O-methyltransferase CheR [Parasporobacterium paucivorans]SHJ31481.1 chemotaxis protein methyltransferase CheR [Parasporobacterium paucivorans DSM 15970]